LIQMLTISRATWLEQLNARQSRHRLDAQIGIQKGRVDERLDRREGWRVPVATRHECQLSRTQ
jgi:hypothetical protein